MSDFKDLLVWQEAHSLTVALYRVTEAFPPTSRYELATQIRRAAG
jgi:four helix bundle protein